MAGIGVPIGQHVAASKVDQAQKAKDKCLSGDLHSSFNQGVEPKCRGDRVNVCYDG